MPVMRVFDLGTFAEQRIGLIKKQQILTHLGFMENRTEMFLGLADIFADHAGEIDLIEDQRQFVGQNLGRQSLADAPTVR